MKKLVTLMLGLSLVFGTVMTAFGKADETTKQHKGKKKGAKKTTENK